MNEARFGPAGNAESFAAAGFRESKDAPAWLHGLGLTAYEYQCGRGVHVGAQTAALIGQAARENGIAVSIHAPYFINLSSEEHERVAKNIGYVLQTARIAVPLGATRMVVHCGGQGKLTRERAMRNTHQNIQHILAALAAEGLTDCTVCLETMGKKSVIGSADEVFELVAADERLLPCIDFGHLNSRTGGGMNSRAAFSALLDQMENRIGAARAARFHAHFSQIEYNDKGEVRHLNFDEEMRFGPEFAPLAAEIAARGYAPTIICESAGQQAEDALTMQRLYRQALQQERSV